MNGTPAVIAAVAPADVPALETALERAERLGFSALLVRVPEAERDRAHLAFSPATERHGLAVGLLIDGVPAGPDHVVLPPPGRVGSIPGRSAALDIRPAPTEDAAHLAAFGRLAAAAKEGGIVAWDGLDRIAPGLEAVLQRGAACREAARSDPRPSGPYALVTGGAGFIGCNLADRLLTAGEDVLLFDSLYRSGVERNLRWLRARHGERVRCLFADLRDRAAVEEAVSGAHSVFHLAAQVAVTTSLVEPRADFETNLLGTFALLEAVRQRCPTAPVIFASTNKVYGDLADVALGLDDEAWQPTDAAIRRHGIGETRPLDFHTPYGCSKGAADQYVLDYARSFGLRAVVLRMSCIYGRLQLGTEDQGWVAHFLRAARAGDPIMLYGDGHQVRDVLDVDDAVSAYLAARARSDRVAGRAFNLGGGPANAVSLLRVLDAIGEILGRTIERRFGGWRQGDQRYFVADTRLARAELGLSLPLDWRNGLARLARWMDDAAAGDRPAGNAKDLQSRRAGVLA